MFWKKCLLGLALSVATFGTSAEAGDTRLMISEPVQGYAFYNRPGASLDEHDAMYRDCFVITSIGDAAPSQGLVFDLVWGGVFKGMEAGAVENCMIARGWRVFQLPEDQGRTFSQLSDDEFRAQFAPLVGATTPPGVLARSWNNETSRPAAYHTPSRVRPPSRHQLSIRSFALRKYELDLRTSAEAAGPSWNSRARGVPIERAASPGPGKALIIVAAVGGNRIMQLARTLDTAEGGFISFGGGREVAWQAFEVPAGRWRISRTSWINHCLGAPAFDVAAGEVVYAGSFDLAGPVLGPVLNLEDVPDRLDAALASRLRVAGYQNGSVAPCPAGGGVYPLEIDGAPFEPGYLWGSRAVAETSAP